ncbi:MAG: hypothetical protein V9G19_10720 [Tetrasphaera sp.]
MNSTDNTRRIQISPFGLVGCSYDRKSELFLLPAALVIIVGKDNQERERNRIRGADIFARRAIGAAVRVEQDGLILDLRQRLRWANVHTAGAAGAAAGDDLWLDGRVHGACSCAEVCLHGNRVHVAPALRCD